MAAGNLFSGLPAAPPAGEPPVGEPPVGEPPVGERFDALLDRPGIRLERIVSTGQATPAGAWYDQPADEWVAVLRGRAEPLIEGEAVPRVPGPGDWLFLPAHCRHRVTRTDTAGPTVWLALHVAPAAG